MIGGRCVKPVRRLRHAARCTRLRTTGTLERAARAGANRVAFSGRIRTKQLKPGRYRLTAVASDAAGNWSAPRSRAFRIVAR